MKRTALVFALALLGCASSSANHPQIPRIADTPYDGPDGAIRGIVIAHDGTPLPGATVTLRTPDGERTAVTRTDGLYEFLNVPVGTQRVTAELAGFTRKTADVDVKHGIARGVTLTLDSASID